MILLRQSGDNCLLYAAAMVLDADPEDICAATGHSGNDIWWPDEVGARKKRSHHPQELIDYAAILGLTFVKIIAIPRIGWTEATCKPIFVEPMKRLERWLMGRRAILLVTSGSLNHAVAWDGKEVFDPKGFKASIEDYEIEVAYILTKLI